MAAMTTVPMALLPPRPLHAFPISIRMAASASLLTTAVAIMLTPVPAPTIVVVAMVVGGTKTITSQPCPRLLRAVSSDVYARVCSCR
jgi:hypothetical protein